MKKYKGIIFDLDGTLLDTIEDLGVCMNEALESLGYPTYEIEEYKLKVGGGFRGLAENSLSKDADKETISKVTNIFAEIYDKNYLNKTKPYDGMDKLLDELISRNVILAINSNKRNDYTNTLVGKYFNRIPFVNVYGERKGLPNKPDPNTALEILSEMRLNKDEVLYIGDSKTDIETANNAKMDSVGVLWGFRDYKELNDTGATYIVEEPKDILKLVYI